jgi:hypothetical protein
VLLVIMSGYQQTLPEMWSRPHANIPAGQATRPRVPGAPSKKRPREENNQKGPNTKRARYNHHHSQPSTREAEMLARGAPHNPRRQHQTRSRVYGTLTRDKKIDILNYLAEQVRQGQLDRSQFESIKRFIMRSQYANNILNVVPQAEGLLTKPGVANNKTKLESRFNRANAKRIMEQFQRGNVENPEIPLETNDDWDRYVNSLVDELGVIRINTNYTNNNNNSSEPPVPLERQTYAQGGKRRRQTRRKARRRN